MHSCAYMRPGATPSIRHERASSRELVSASAQTGTMFTGVAVAFQTAWRLTPRFRRAHVRIERSSGGRPDKAGASPPSGVSLASISHEARVPHRIGGRLERDPLSVTARARYRFQIGSSK
jgi:hypothetical protein